MVFLGLANGVGLGILMLCGFAAILVKLYSKKRKLKTSPTIRSLLQSFPQWKYFFPAVPAFIYLCTLNLLPSVMNWHDDFEKYLKHPVRILATGGLQTGPFDASGESVLGGMAFLHSIALLVGSLQFVTVIDGVIAPVCALLIFASACKHLGVHPLWTVFGTLLFLSIDPMVVNISAVYMIVLPLVVLFSASIQAPDGEGQYRGWILLLSLSYAALITVKSSSAFFVPLHFSLTLGAMLLARRLTRERLKYMIFIPVVVSGMTLPWFLVHWEKLLGAFTVTQTLDASGSGIRVVSEQWEPLSTEVLFYTFGISSLTISLLLAGVFGTFIQSLFAYRKAPSPQQLMQAVNSLSVFLFFTAAMVYLVPRMNGLDAVLRYVMPFLLASSVLFFYASSTKTKSKGRPSHLLLRAYALVCILLFMPSLTARYLQAKELGHVIAIPFFKDSRYIGYSQWLLGDTNKRRFIEAQLHTPENAKLLVWSLGSYHLDYSRNSIWDVDPSGFSAPWQKFPFEGTLDSQLRFLVEHEVDSIIWQYDGFGIRTAKALRRPNLPLRVEINWGTICFAKFLTEISKRDDLVHVVYDDGSLRVIVLKTELSTLQGK